MKRILLLSLLVSGFLMGLDPERLIRFTAVNKSGVELGIRLINEEKELNYYLTIPEGDQEFPAEREFTIIPATYQMQVFYQEWYDPVYGYPECEGLILPAQLIAMHNLKITFWDCLNVPPARGEPHNRPFWNWKPWKHPYIIMY